MLRLGEGHRTSRTAVDPRGNGRDIEQPVEPSVSTAHRLPTNVAGQFHVGRSQAILGNTIGEKRCTRLHTRMLVDFEECNWQLSDVTLAFPPAAARSIMSVYCQTESLFTPKLES
jgi:hypothetical protein